MAITRQQWKAAMLQATALEQRLAEIESPDPEALKRIAPYVGFGKLFLPRSFLYDQTGYQFVDVNWHALETVNLNDHYGASKNSLRYARELCSMITRDAYTALTGRLGSWDDVGDFDDFNDFEVTSWEAAQNLVRLDVLELIAKHYPLEGADRIVAGIDAARKPFRDATDPHKVSTDISEVFGRFYVHDPWSLYDGRGFTETWANQIYANAQKVGEKFDKHDDTGKLLLRAFAAEYFVELSLKKEAYGDDGYSLKWFVGEQMEVLNKCIWEELTGEERGGFSAGQTHMYYVNECLQRADPKLASWYKEKILDPYDKILVERYRWGMGQEGEVIEGVKERRT
jgi:hypothetical protein